MKLPRPLAGAPALALYPVLLSALPLACATSRAGHPAAGAASSPTAAADLSITKPARPSRPTPLGPTLDRQGCDPKGKLTLVVQQGAKGEPTIWRYYAAGKHGGARVLRCEASDNNGDGFVDARFFYDEAGQLVLEQRDLDFDGHAEVIADYSHFSVGHLVQASDKE
ncbi:MAG TPA: hypothetical protein VHL80_13005 [Polyangia bacterium]|nr:hypothetical protein [Polyangia bacterium]